MHHRGEGQPPYRADCDCRKPRPGLLHRAAADLDLDLAASVMVGDKLSDVAAGHAVGAAGGLVLTGDGRGGGGDHPDGQPVKPDHGAEDLPDPGEGALARTPPGARARSVSPPTTAGRPDPPRP